MYSVEEKPLADDVQSELETAANEALQWLELGKDSDPSRVVSAIDEAVYARKKSQDALPQESDSEIDLDRLMSISGSLWGFQLVRGLGWSWAEAMIGSGPSRASVMGLFSPQRELVIFPFHFLHAVFEHDAEVTIALAFTVLKEGKRIPQLEPFSYVNVMEHIFHTPPRK